MHHSSPRQQPSSLNVMATGFNRLGASAYSNSPAIAMIQPAAMTVEQRVEALKQKFTAAMSNVAVNRKVIFGVLEDIKEHYHEYGYKTVAAGVEGICQRSKSWAYNFCAEIEAELEIYGKIIPADSTTVDAEADKAAKKESVSLKRVENSREEEPEKPHIMTAPERIAANGELKPMPIKATENGKPKSQLAVWEKAEGIGGAFLRAVDDINRLCPNKAFHDHTLNTIKEAMRATRQWRDTVK